MWCKKLDRILRLFARSNQSMLTLPASDKVSPRLVHRLVDGQHMAVVVFKYI